MGLFSSHTGKFFPHRLGPYVSQNGTLLLTHREILSSQTRTLRLTEWDLPTHRLELLSSKPGTSLFTAWDFPLHRLEFLYSQTGTPLLTD
jgi:hypothetical protein